MTPRVAVRPIGADERAAWEPLWLAYLDFYGTKLSQAAIDTAWARIHEPSEPMFALGAYVDGTLKGIVHYLYHRSMWTPGNYCYLQDLFVEEGARKLGLGRALIEATEAEARKAGASRIYWLTQEGNSTARALYDKLAERSGFIQYRKVF